LTLSYLETDAAFRCFSRLVQGRSNAMFFRELGEITPSRSYLETDAASRGFSALAQGRSNAMFFSELGEINPPQRYLETDAAFCCLPVLT